MRKSSLFLLYFLINAFFLAALAAHAYYGQETASVSLNEKKALVRDLELTDLGLCTEASYTRHLTQADWHTPFQDHPFALEHFPSGSFLPPARPMGRPHG
jgi:hypothetical protein